MSSMDEYGVFGVAILSHFCELHGPSIVFCTQMVHPFSSVMGVESIEAEARHVPGGGGRPVAPAAASSPRTSEWCTTRPSQERLSRRSASVAIAEQKTSTPTLMRDGSFVQPDPFASVQRPISIATAYMSPMGSEGRREESDEDGSDDMDRHYSPVKLRWDGVVSGGGDLEIEVESHGDTRRKPGAEPRKERQDTDDEDSLDRFVKGQAQRDDSAASDFTVMSGDVTLELEEEENEANRDEEDEEDGKSADSDYSGVGAMMLNPGGDEGGGSGKSKRRRTRSFASRPRFPSFDPFNRSASGSVSGDKRLEGGRAKSVAGGEVAPSGRKCTSCSSIEDGTGFMSMDTMHAAANPRYSTMSTTSVTAGPNPSAKGFSGLYVEQEAQVSGDGADRAFRYFSTREPCSALYGACRRAVVRGLSCEVCEGREGPLIWFDPASGLHVLSYTFKVRDIEARGEVRYYALMVLLHEGSLLMAAYKTIVAHLERIIQQLQQRSDNRFTAEEAAKAKQEQQEATTGRPVSTGYSTHAMALGRGRADMINARFRGMGLGASGGYRSQIARPASRSLVELLQYKHLYRDVHICFSQTLRVVAGHLQDKYLVATINPASMAASSLLPEEDDEEKDHYAATERRISYKELFERIGMEKAIFVLYHLLVGNQVIVRGNDRELVMDILELLKMLTPANCHMPCLYSAEYVERFRGNLLGLPAYTAIPRHVDPKTVCVIDVLSTLSIEVLEADDHRERERNSLEVISQAAIARASSEVLEQQQFVVGSVHDESLDDETARLVSMDVSTPPRRGLSLTLKAFEMRDDKAHTSLGLTLARVLTSTASGTSQESIRSQIEVVLQDWVCKSKLFYKLSKAVDNKRDGRVARFFEVLSLHHAADEHVLRFFTTGFRKSMLRNQIWEAVHPS